jgi:multidrug transporter EmrE-like cation transporter
MNVLVLIVPIAFLIAVGQVLIKWRSQSVIPNDKIFDFFEKLSMYLSDGYIVLAYVMALLGSFIWLLVIPRIPLSIGFPIYIGSTFLLVMLGSFIFLNESLSLLRFFAVSLILSGIVLGGLN